MGVEFDEPTLETPGMNSVKKASVFERLVMDVGVAKTREGSRIVLIILAFIMLGFAAFLFFRATTPPPAPTPDEYPYWPRT